MKIEIGLTQAQVNTQFAPLAALCAHYQAHQTLQPLACVPSALRTRAFRPTDKLLQVLLSMLTGCETLSEVNPRLKGEQALATLWGWPRFADQSNLSRLLDELSQTQIEALRQQSRAIWWPLSQIRTHNWHGYLWLDFDLTGLPCSALAEASQKGYFSDKKTPPAAS